MLQKVNVTLMPEQRCDAYFTYFNTNYESYRILKRGILDVSMICATGKDHHSCEVRLFPKSNVSIILIVEVVKRWPG